MPLDTKEQKSLEQRLASLSDEDKIRAFNKLFECQRVRMLGYSCEGPDGISGKIKLIGMEIWKEFREIDDADDKHTLLNFLLERPATARCVKQNKEPNDLYGVLEEQRDASS